LFAAGAKYLPILLFLGQHLSEGPRDLVTTTFDFGGAHDAALHAPTDASPDLATFTFDLGG